MLAHAEALKTINDIKDQLARARTAARENQNASETAQAKLAASEASWRQQKEALDKEIAELNKRHVKPRVKYSSVLRLPVQVSGPQRTEQPATSTPGVG